MPATQPVIQSYFKQTSSLDRPLPRHDLLVDDQGNLKQSSHYDVDIGSIIPGPQSIRVTGRIANIASQSAPMKAPQGANGAVRLIVKDDTGALIVRLWHRVKQYRLFIGQLVSLWTGHVCTGGTAAFGSTAASLAISIFPERDRNCGIESLDQDSYRDCCRAPLTYALGVELKHLLTLQDYISGGCDNPDARLLVYVTSIGDIKKIMTRSGATDTTTLYIADHTASASFSLWSSACASARTWQPGVTVLLISGATYHQGRSSNIRLTPSSLVDVDPAMADATWLRNFASSPAPVQYNQHPFPDNVFDVSVALSATTRTLYTLSEIDLEIRASPTLPQTFFASLTLVESTLLAYHTRKALLAGRCSRCSLAIYANTTSMTCAHCGNVVQLHFDAHALGGMSDETGVLEAGACAWNGGVLKDFVGRETDAWKGVGGGECRELDGRLTGSRFDVLLGWPGERRKQDMRLMVLAVLG